MSAARSGCATLPSLQPCLLGIGAHGRLERLRRPGLDAFEPRQQAPSIFAPGLVEQLLGLRIEGERALGEEKVGIVEKLDQGLGALLQSGQRALELAPAVRIDLGGKLAAIREAQARAP